MARTGTDKMLWSITVTVTGILSAWLCLVTPLQFDDFWFLADTRHDASLWQRLAETWQRAWELCTHTDTGRLPNLLAPPMLVLPRFVFAALSGLCVATLLIYSRRLAGLRAGQPLSFILAAAIILLLPWFDFMYSVMFCMNYVWSSVLVLIAAWLILRASRSGKRPPLWIFAVCFAAGWSHEGLSLPLLCGLSVYFLTRRKEISRGGWMLAIAIALGAALIFLSPAIWMRTGYSQAGMGRFPLREAAVHLIIGNGCFYVFAILGAFCLCIKRLRGRLLREPELLIWSVAAVAATVLFVKYYAGPRLGWAPQLFSLIGTAQIFRSMGIRTGTKTRYATGGVCLAAICVNLGAAVKEEYALRAEEIEIRRQFTASSDGVIFLDITRPKLSPALFKSSVRQFNERIPMWDYSQYYGYGRNLVILPRALRGFDGSNGAPALTLKGAQIYSGYLIVPQGFELPATLEAVTSQGRFATRYRKDSFSTPDGRGWILVVPHEQVLRPGLKIK